jgi:Tfp pilus assembly protein PilV
MKRKRKAIRNQRGFLLVETMIAVVVFAIGALTLAAVMPLGIRKSNQANQQSRASELVARKAEELLATPYSDSDLDEATHDDTSNPYPGDYYARWVVEDDQPIASCKRITITVARTSVTTTPLARLVVVKPQAG